ncbi:uncharacterized protein CMU_008120 [Cryptosporidium muris RN66]|uniref:C2H2-type domain-containing protein n=1 Tax=Cryptosporidium muris (strain RN66) TaxID=441375 RepID=B6ADN0_CRYMR|nr:uncharacterized protein CMU_008120 [Cryptosporidium muris RN66]EEA06321.1 hypothetical protein, conserved [Cryptosporidium muris RN66]|eukprot:XP_002140670.1 hypothetical protein [Cryptosporidium muris RN66]
MYDRSRRGSSPSVGHHYQDYTGSSNGYQNTSALSSHYQSQVDSSHYIHSDNNPAMTFKQFMMNQSDNLSPSELLDMYDKYRTKHVQKYQQQYLENHKSFVFILERFHPIWLRKVIDERQTLVERRFNIFKDKLVSGELNNIDRSVDKLEFSSVQIIHNNTCADVIFTNPLKDRETWNILGKCPLFSTDIGMYLLVLSDVPINISLLDILNFLNNDFPQIGGGTGTCPGLIDASLSTPRYIRGVLNRSCYLLFDSMCNRNTAMELLKGKTIKASVTTESIGRQYNKDIYPDNNNELNDEEQFSNLNKSAIYVIQMKTWELNTTLRYGILPKLFSSKEQLNRDSKYLWKIIDKFDSDQNLFNGLRWVLENLYNETIFTIEQTVDIQTLYLRFVHGFDYYSLITPNVFQFGPFTYSQPDQDLYSNKLNQKDDNLVDGDISTQYGVSHSTSDLNTKNCLSEYINYLIFTRSYFELAARNKYRGGWIRSSSEGNGVDIKQTTDDLEISKILKYLEYNVDRIVRAAPLINMIEKPIMDDDDQLSTLWSRYCEQHTLRKKADRWQCGKCLKQFKGEHFVHKHLAKKHRDSLETIREEITFDRIIKPLYEKFSFLINPSNLDDFNVNHSSHRRVYYHHGGSGHKQRHNRFQKSAPYERRPYRDWDLPKQTLTLNFNTSSQSSDLRASIKYDDL